jgi:hypothetical protein
LLPVLKNETFDYFMLDFERGEKRNKTKEANGTRKMVHNLSLLGDIMKERAS